jgi:sugar O-acyltransferase (sialic acid O-acetyltransferase NeuD family)
MPAAMTIESKRSAPPELRPLVMIGAGRGAASVANVALAMGYRIACCVDPDRRIKRCLGYEVVADMKALGDHRPYSFALAIGDNAIRERVVSRLIDEHPDIDFPALIHPSATISLWSHIGQGSIVMPQAVVGAASLVGRFCLLNTRASIDHDGVMKDFSSLAPAVVTGGHVVIGRRAAVSIGAVIKHGVSIGDDCLVGANSYLNRDLACLQLAYGSPARVVRARTMGEPYLD